MKRNWRVGCAGFPVKLSSYMQDFSTVEIQETFYDPPAKRILTRWRKEAPEGFAFIMRAWQMITHPPTYPGYQKIRRPWEHEAAARFGSFLPGDQTRWAWEILKEAAEIVDARAILFQTPASFTPTRVNRDNLVRFFSDIQRGKCHLVWEPEGIWEEEEIKAICSDLDLVPAVDPLVSGIAAGEVFYFRFLGKTRTRGDYSYDDFFSICQDVEASEDGIGREGFFIWKTRAAVHDGRRFRKWLGQQQ